MLGPARPEGSRRHVACWGQAVANACVSPREALINSESSRLNRESQGRSWPLDERVEDPFLAGLVEVDGELVALDRRHPAIAELLMEDAFADTVRGRRAG